MKTVKFITIIFAATVICTSCDFLDVSEAMSGELTKEEVFNNPSQFI